MTLNRSNPEPRRRVIDRNDDSAQRVRVAVIGGRGLALEVLIDALRRSGITAWRVPPNAPAPALLRRADLAVVDLGAIGGIEPPFQTVRRLADRELDMILLDDGAEESPIGAEGSVDISNTSFDDLLGVIRGVAAGSARRPDAPKGDRRSARIISFDDALH
jgi:hypothetical protein